MNDKYIKLKQEIRDLLKETIAESTFEEAVELYYDVAEISEEDSLNVAFEIIYKEAEDFSDDLYIEETFVENVDESFFRHGTQSNINSLKKIIAENDKKPGVNQYFQKMVDLSDDYYKKSDK